MPITIGALCNRIRPDRTSLLLGAGASVPSGAPSSAELSHRLWRVVAGMEAQSDDLQDTAGILERRFSRRDVVQAIVEVLRPLDPTGGLLALPRFDWRAIFTTNFDLLIEKAFRQAGKALVPIRSNFDFSYQETHNDTRLYKIHGCISQDRSLGDRSSLTLTEQDYDDFRKYRQTIYANLQARLYEGDVLVIGQSLRDRHLNELVKQVLHDKADGAGGEIYLLVFDRDDLRAPLLEDRGARVAFGSIDEFVHGMTAAPAAPANIDLVVDGNLPATLVSTVDDVQQARLREPKVIRMFNGSPATYADIRALNTFERAQAGLLVDQMADQSTTIVSIVGAAGVGKTTLARQLLSALREKGIGAFEHRNDFIFQHQQWVSFESELRSSGMRAVLMLDECTRYMRQVNLLVESIGHTPGSALQLVLTANAAQWEQRVKSPTIYRSARIATLSQLADSELNSLINLVLHNPAVSGLVQQEFKALGRNRQFARLRERCSADMFVCLKNIFANDSLDQILLAEYEELDTDSRQNYRYVAALEAVGMRVHRQLVMRMLSLPADRIADMLGRLVGIVDEFEINAREGIYGWSTRHLVIARKITEYKFSAFEDIKNLFEQIIASINPSVPTELQSLRDLCDVQFGIGRLGDAGVRKELYRQLIALAPAERIPWHRFIRELLSEGNYEEASFAIRDATVAVGADAPIDRYSVRLLVLRAETTAGLGPDDRVAILRRAYELAHTNIDRHRQDKHSYRVLCEVAKKLVERGSAIQLLDEAIERMQEGFGEILDPDMQEDLRRYQQSRMQLR